MGSPQSCSRIFAPLVKSDGFRIASGGLRARRILADADAIDLWTEAEPSKC